MEMKIEIGWIGALGTLKETDTCTMYVGVNTVFTELAPVCVEECEGVYFLSIFWQSQTDCLATDTDVRLLSSGKHITATATGR